MVKNKELSTFQRDENFGLHKGKHSQRDISKILNVPRTTIQSILKSWLGNNYTNDIPLSGRPRKLTNRDLRSLRTTLKKSRWATLSTITDQFNADVIPKRVSTKTISRRLHEMGCYARVPKRKPLISIRNKKRRLVFYQTQKLWDLSHWKNLIWSDESRFKLFNNDGRKKV